MEQSRGACRSVSCYLKNDFLFPTRKLGKKTLGNDRFSKCGASWDNRCTETEGTLGGMEQNPKLPGFINERNRREEEKKENLPQIAWLRKEHLCRRW